MTDTSTENAIAAARAEGAAAERARISSIVNCREASGKEVAALGLALTADVTLETAKTVLSGSRADFEKGRAIARSVGR